MYFLNRFQNFDIYAKPVDDCRIKTSFGGLITLLCFIIIGLLFISEIAAYFFVEISEQLFVDSTNSEIKVDINFDITFSNLPCEFASIDAIGLGSENKNAIKDNVIKQRLNKFGKIIENNENQILNTNNKEENKTILVTTLECGSCYGASSSCCNTCDEVKEAYRLRNWQISNFSEIYQCKNEKFVKALTEKKDEGCRIYGKINVGKVHGNLHIAPSHLKIEQNFHNNDFNNLTPFMFNLSHTFNHFSFGKPFPKKQYPLDGKSFVSKKGSIMHYYYLKVVPTTYIYSITSKNQELSYQFSITRQEKDVSSNLNGMPGVFIIYEFSPLMVYYQEKHKSFTSFAVSLCAIIGGVFTVASLLDSFIYSGSRVVQRKFQIGKAN